MIKFNRSKLIYQKMLLKKIKGTFIIDKENTFSKKLEKKMLLMQLPNSEEEWIENFHLTRAQFESLKNTMKKRGEKVINLAIIELEKGVSLETSEEYYLFDINTTYDEYSSFQIINECVLYGEKEEWAILLSSEDCSILAGIPDFVKLYKESYTIWKNDLIRFKEMSDYFLKKYNSQWGINLIDSMIKEEKDLSFDEKNFLSPK